MNLVSRVPATHALLLALLLTALSVIAETPFALANAIGQDNVANQGGQTMQTPIKAYLIYWLPSGQKYDTTPTIPDGIGNYEQVTQQFFRDVAGSAYFNIVTQYTATCGNSPCILTDFLTDVVLGGTYVD